MIYTMNGMMTQLNLKADKTGVFRGLSSHYSGDGFADMHFEVEAVPPDRFSAWIAETRNSGPQLTPQSYADLARQSSKVAPFTYGGVDSDLFQKVVQQVLPPGPGPVKKTNPSASRQAEK
jgi:cytochrome o ubiquinol oxidase subunit 2